MGYIAVPHDDHKDPSSNSPLSQCTEGTGRPSSHCIHGISTNTPFNVEVTTGPRIPNADDFSHYVLSDEDVSGSLSKEHVSLLLPCSRCILNVRWARDDRALFIGHMNSLKIDASQAPTVAPRDHIPEFIGGTIGGIIGLILLVLAGVFFYRRRKVRLPASYSTGPLQASLPTSKEAFTSRKYSNYGLSFAPSPSQSTDVLSTLPQSPARQSRRNERLLTMTPETI